MERSLAGLEKQVASQNAVNLIRNPFFVPSTDGATARGWTAVGVPVYSLVDLGVGKNREVDLPANGVLLSDIINLNAGSAPTLALPDFTMGLYVAEAATSSTPNVRMEVVDINNAVLAVVDMMAGGSFDVLSTTITLPAATTQLRVRITALASVGLRIRMVYMTPGNLIPLYVNPAALSEGDLEDLYYASSQLTAQYDQNMAAILNEASVRATADSAEAIARQTLSASIGGQIDAKIVAERIVRVNAEEALAQEIDTYTAQLNSNTASITNEITARATADGALAQEISTLSTTVGNNTTTIAQHTSSLNGLSASWGVDITQDINGVHHVSGIKLNADATGSSTFSVLANKFEIIDPGSLGGTPTYITPFSYSGGVISLNSNIVVNATVTFQSSNWAGGVAGGSPTGFKLTGTPFNSTFFDGSVSQVLMEVGGSANFGGFPISHVTEKIFQAQAASWYSGMPNNWGGGSLQLSLTKTNASGTYLSFSSDNQFVIANTAGLYLVNGHTAQSSGGCGNHDSTIEVWQRPNGGTGSTDVSILNWHEPDCSGSTFVPYNALVSMGVGDKLYYKSTSKGGGWIVGQVVYLGSIGATTPIAITNTDITAMEASGQTYPKILQFAMNVINSTGVPTYSISGGTGAGYASVDSSGLVSFSCPSVGSWTLNLHAVDPQGNQVTKGITITLSAYTFVALSITNGSFSDSTSSYPYSVSQALTAAGGVPPYTWSLVAGDPANTLPSGAVASGYVSGTVSGAGSWTLKVRCTDSNGTPNVVDATLTYTVSTLTGGGGGGTGGCFDPETYILLDDGSAVQFKDIKAGTYVKGLDLGVLTSFGTMAPVRALVTDVLLHDIPNQAWMLVDNVKTTPEHPWIVTYPCTSCANNLRKGYWDRAENLNNNFDYKLVSLPTGTELNGVEVPAGVVTTTTGGTISMNLATTANTFFVATSAQGPWYAVHNIKMLE